MGQPDLIGDSRTVEPGYPTCVPPGAVPSKLAGEDAPHGRVYLNPTTYFDGVAPETWTQQVGGYQPLEKWLKDRRGRTLTFADVQHYAQTAAALDATRGLMEKVDAVINAASGFPLACVGEERGVILNVLREDPPKQPSLPPSLSAIESLDSIF